MLTGCFGRKAEVEIIEDAYKEESSSNIEESVSYEGDEVFYEPRDSTETSSTIDENKQATETTTQSSTEDKGKVEV